jgi:hypothetical protein
MSTEFSPSSSVPAGGQATWSDRFEQGLNPAIERFNASIGFDITLLQEDLDGSVAHARMLGRCGVISPAEAQQLIDGLEAIRAEAAAGQFCPGIEAEDVHFAVERRLTERLGALGSIPAAAAMIRSAQICDSGCAARSTPWMGPCGGLRGPCWSRPSGMSTP